MISSRFQEVARSCGKTVPCGATVVGAHLQAISSLAVSSRRAGPLSMPSRSSFESLGVKVEIQQSHLDLKDDVEREKSTVFDTSYGRHPRVPFRRIHSPTTTKPINATQDTSKLFLSDSDRGNAFYFMPQLREQRRRNSPSNYVLPISSTFSCYCPTKLRQQSFLTLHPQRSIYLLGNLPQKRCFTASKDYKTRGDSSSLDKSTNCRTPLHRKRDESTGGLPPIQEIVDSTVETVRPIVESAEMNLRKAVDIVRLQDLGTLYGVVLLVFLVVTTPFVARRMRRSDDNNEPDVNPEDPVMDLAKTFRDEFLARQDGEEGNSASVMGLDRIVADLLRSPQVQETINDLVASVIQSPQFKTACQLLLKELLKDLLDDPDTLKQVIHLLQNAIVDEKVREASIQLVTDVFGDDRVLDELVAVVQRLGMEQQVQLATQALLVESAHNALNDPEILDHSMEFATDVVGDDVVQQTAGEALFNTFSYAIRPTLSFLLTFLGIGLIALSLSAFRSANEAPGESVDQAFLKAVEESYNRLFKLLCLPVDLVAACRDSLTSILFFPYRVVSSAVINLSQSTRTLIDYMHTWFLWLFNLPGDFFSTIYDRFGDIYQYLGSLVLDRILMVKTTNSQISRFLNETAKRMSGLSYRTRMRWIRFNKMLSDVAIAIEGFGVPYLEMLSRLAEDSAQTWTEASKSLGGISTTLHSRLADINHWCSMEYTALNWKISRWGISIESMINTFTSTIRKMCSS